MISSSRDCTLTLKKKISIFSGMYTSKTDTAYVVWNFRNQRPYSWSRIVSFTVSLIDALIKYIIIIIIIQYCHANVLYNVHFIQFSTFSIRFSWSAYFFFLSIIFVFRWVLYLSVQSFHQNLTDLPSYAILILNLQVL